MPGSFTLADHPALSGPMGPLFEQLRERVVALGPSISMSIFKGYIAFVHTGHFCDVLPRKRYLRVLLNSPYGFLDDPENACKDISGTFGPFEMEFDLASLDEMDYCVGLVRQAYMRDRRF